MDNNNRKGLNDRQFETDREEDGLLLQEDYPRRQRYSEETAAEIATPLYQDRNKQNNIDGQVQGRGLGFTALILSILSLFIFPTLFGAAGIVMGFVARRRGVKNLGAWAIGIGIASIVIAWFIVPLGNFRFR